MQIRSLLVAALAAGTASAHMNMKDPAPLAYKGNPNAKEPNIDYSITSPITAAQYPCKGNLKLLGTPEGAPVKTYAPGQSYTMSVEGGAAHNGGSCQLSLSYDKGNSFTVIKSFIGNCPTSSGGTFNFAIPSDAPTGDEVVFAWTWVNHTGNREFYMSCAVVSIKGGASKRDAVTEKRAVAFASRPKVFTANLGGEYCTKEGVDTVFPDPGPDVENTSTSPGPAILCATGADAPAGSSGSGSSDSGSGSGAGSSASAGSSAAPATSAQKPSSAVAQKPTSAAEAQPTITGGVFLTEPPSGASSSAAAAPTTFSTAVSAPSGGNSGAAPSSADSAPTSVVAVSPTSSANVPATTGVGAGTGAVSGAQSGPCPNEGDWACSADGASFQRCASGQWSAAIPMAAGTKCTPGVSNDFAIGRVRRNRVRRSGNGLAY